MVETNMMNITDLLIPVYRIEIGHTEYQRWKVTVERSD